MAVDLLVMPISRYIAGDYITPMMQGAWDEGIPYSILGPNGAVELLPGIPFGGNNASERRREIAGMVADDLQPYIEDLGFGWDEGSDAAPSFHRFSHDTYAAGQELLNAKKGVLGFGRRAAIPELATLFLPQSFEGVFSMEEPLDVMFASAPETFEKLRHLSARKHRNESARFRNKINDSLAEFVTVMSAAFRDAIETGFPVIIDG